MLRRRRDPGGETDQPEQEGDRVPWGRRSFLFGGEAGVGWRRGGGRAEKSETFGGEDLRRQMLLARQLHIEYWHIYHIHHFSKEN